jgi:prepilin-type N-terminal cleavage/methylation domain-containing protein
MPAEKAPVVRSPLGRKQFSGFTLIELMIVVTIVGLLAAIAIPTFTKSVRRSRTTEALLGLRKIYDGSVTYFDMDHVTPDGHVVPHQFPGSVGLTPGDPPAGQRAESDPDAWEIPTWRALSFGVSDPYYYAYQYLSETDPGLECVDDGFHGTCFVATAHGDLDGDGFFSFFARAGTVEQMQVRGSGIIRAEELE